MAESMVGLKRTHRCTEVTTAHIGQEVTVMGWVQKSRNKGGIIFVDLRDRSGILQIIFEENDCGAENFAKAEKLRSEFVVAVTGRVEARSGAVNTNLATGAIEIRANSMRILSESETPPFPIEENSKTKEELRLKYRFLDLRRPDIQKNLMIRSQVATLTRAFLASEGFLEIETPTLIKSTPEGARDYLVPSRVHPGSFYALPQSPQLFKQLLMCSGYDRYFQLARCYRDEDLRADRQPEFTQIDMELSFVDVDDVLDVNERLLKKLFKEICGFDVQLPIPRMTWQEAMDRFGSDKPDLRFGMELKNVSEVVKGCEFAVFKGALENGGSVRGINAQGQGHMPRKKIDALVEYAKGFGARGLAYVAISEDGTVKSSFAKFMKEEEMTALISAMDGKPGDLLLFAADRNKVVFDVLGNLRLELARQLDLLKKDDFKFLWVTEFPLLEYSEEEDRYVAMHHPFTMPMDEDLQYIDSDPGRVRAKAYDIVLNGVEMGGGSVRIHQADIQSKMFEVLGFTPERAGEQFGFLLEAFKYGVPPHAGLAYGLDRVVMLMVGADSIRDVIAFPKVKDASCLMTEFIVAYNLLGSIFRGLGNSRLPLISVSIACLVNIAGDLLLVGVFHMASAGAAIATVFAQAVSVVLSILIIRKQKLPFAFRKESVRYDRQLAGRVVKLGFPIAFQDVLVSISFLVISAIVNTLGVIPSAGVGVAEKLCGFVLLVPSAYGQAMSAFVAQNIGARRPERAKRALAYGILTSLGVGVFLAYFSFFHGDLLAGVFSRDREVVLAAADYLRAYAIDCLLVSFMFCMTGFFNGCGRTAFVMFQGIAGAFGVRIPVSYLMSHLVPVSLFKIGLATPASTLLQILLCGIYLKVLNRDPLLHGTGEPTSRPHQTI